ncbi:MAG TPA: hypothetical protein VKH64_08915 [Candidatus Binatia bacterium]|nr:hypothetical protein [Candidatus Binatia bacterium]
MKDYSENYFEDRASAVFESDPLVVERYLSTVKNDMRQQPERLLMLAVLEDGIRSFQKYSGSESPVSKKHFKDAEEWIFDIEDDGAFSFEGICAEWNLDAAYLRLGLLHWLERSRRGKRPQLRLVAKNQAVSPRAHEPLSMAPLLLREDIPDAARRALVARQPQKAGKALMKAFSLTCDEAKQLVDADPCAKASLSNN